MADNSKKSSRDKSDTPPGASWVLVKLEDKINIIKSWKHETPESLPLFVMPEAIESDGYYFVAHSRKDFKIVYTDILRLESVGVDIWYDRAMEPSKDWRELARRMMNRQECKGVIVYGTVNSMASEPVQIELLVADELGKNIIFINHGEDSETATAKDLYEEACKDKEAKEAEETTEEDRKRVKAFKDLLDRKGNPNITYIDLAVSPEKKKDKLDKIKPEEVLIYERQGGHASVVGVKYIGVRSIDIPEEICVSNEEFKVSKIDACAFANCQNLEDVKVPRKLWSIGEHAFYNCRKLTTVHLGGYISEVAENAFVGCSALTRYDVDDIEIAGMRLSKFFSKDGVLYRQPKSTRIMTIHQVPHKLTGSVVLPSGVSKIEEGTFSHCDNITSITIPCSVVSISEGAFRGCNLLESFMVESGNPVYHSAGKCIIETKTKTLVAGCGSSVIPDDGSVTSIGGFAFSYCDSLTSVTIPNTVTRIRAGAFHSCGGLVTISIPSSVVDIGMLAFANCVSLVNIDYAGTINQWIDLVGRGRHLSRFFLGSHGTVKCKDGDVPVTAEDRGE